MASPIDRRSAPRFFWVWAGLWLFYLLEPATRAWERPHLWERIVGLAAVLAFSVVYLLSFMSARATLRETGRGAGPLVTWGRLGAMAGLAAILTLIVGKAGLAALVYIAVLAVFTLTPVMAWSVVVLLALVGGVLPQLVSGWNKGLDLPFSIAVASLAVWSVSRVVVRNAQLAAAREEITRLAIAAERNRFGRDMHDLLGHSLTVVSVKTELAARLLHIAPDRAEAELADVQRLVREALVDVRAAVGGYREMSLAGELFSARAALDAAGIEAEVPATAGNVPADRQELFAWVVREGVTNVVRHSDAKQCRITLSAGAVEVVDDGIGPVVGRPDGVGHGLSGLRERVSAAGGSLSVGQATGRGFALRVTV